MKYRIIFILFFSVLQVFSQFMPIECNSGVTTELLSASNSKPGYNGFMGWACGVNGVIIKGSQPGFGQWRNQTGHGVPTSISLNNICAVDTSIAFVCGTSGSNTFVWKTTNGGLNWTQIFIQPNGYINAVFMLNTVKGFMEGNPVNGRWSLWKTTNGGISWDSSGLYLPQAGTETGLSNSLCIPLHQYNGGGDTNRIWFGTNNYRMYYSSNFGMSWNTLSTSPEQYSYCIDFGLASYSIPTIFTGGANFLLKSTNYGLNWTQVSIGGSGNITGISKCEYTFYLTRGNQIFETDFTGNNWNLVFTAASGIYRYLDNRGIGESWVDHYAVRSSGGISFMVEGEGIKKIGNEIPQSFSLNQNYPNPFNPTTKIKFDVPADNSPLYERGVGGFVTLKIYDILGREVTNLVNGELQPGSYSVDWPAPSGNASSFSSGIYFYKLTSGDFSETKKMILIK